MSDAPRPHIEVTWLGHAAFAITYRDESILIDPWLSGNPLFPGLPSGFNPSLILVTHGHFDHLGQAVELSQEHQIPILAPGETGVYCKEQGAETVLINVGGSLHRENSAIKCVPALHSNSVGPERRYGGQAAGFVINLGGFRIYHAGDTAFFNDMALVNSRHRLDLALLPIGGRTTMGPDDALDAVRLLEPTTVIPMHYNTWDFLQQDAGAFAEMVRQDGAGTCLVPEPGALLVFDVNA